MSEPLFAPVKTTDDDDDAAGDGGPTATLFQDDPQAGVESIFDWGSGDDTGGSHKRVRDSKEKKRASDADEFDAERGEMEFSPVSLRDDDEESGDAIRRKANTLINQRIHDDDSDDDDRIFVGGGWGRHGAQFACCPKGLCASCCGDRRPPRYSRGRADRCAQFRASCALAAFLVLVLGAGFLGYEAGLPAPDADGGANGDGAEREKAGSALHFHGTRGEEWLEWIEREKDEIHLPRWNLTAHHRSNPAFRKPVFEPLAQSELLHLSENVFQSCSERSLRTSAGHDACLSFCHGHYCCFERDPAFGSCVGEEHSYCFAYAACENVLGDFEMNNVAHGLQAGDAPGRHEQLNALDVKLLEETCSEDNIATIEGRRDCTAFCKHNLCCFDEWEGESCRKDNVGHCEAYSSCVVLVDAPKDTGGGASESESEGDSAGHSNENANAGIEIAVKAVCGLKDQVAACNALCADHLCCFSADGTQGSCYNAYGEDVCHAYEACQALNF